MKKIKDLLNKIVGLEGKKKRLILVSSTAVFGVAVIAGIALMYKSNTSNEFAVSRAEIEESNKGDKPTELTEEAKVYNTKVTSYLDAVKRLKEYGVEYGDGVTPSEDEIDKSLEEIYAAIKVEEDKKLAAYEEEEKKKQEEEEEKESQSETPVSETPSSPVETPTTPSQPEAPIEPSVPQEEPSQPSTPVETPVAPTPEPEPAPVVPETPSIPSGWKDDIASSIYNTFSTAGRTNTTANVTQESLDYVRSRVEGWFNGDGSSIGSINSDSLSNVPVDGALYLKLYTLTSFSVQGLNVDNIINATANNVMSPGQVDFCWVKVYYDSATDTSTVYFADGALDI